ncbi:3-oxo-tetronate kinase [Herbiconiux sp. A18JL235]|uniref:3-oxo-tetronate kinase n=1 Tax=Herbiconiux sp. A18JL235 TaxID=3152363 RepID=A0AB39BED4_9MICO
MLRLGAIADDFTGATDLATSLRERGFRVAVLLGADALRSATDDLAELDAVVVALKTRTIPAADAIAQSLAALRGLAALDPEQYFVKYCSTFDSTPAGNIGPVLDAVLDEVGERRTVVVPSFPDNGRTVVHGELFVNGEPLSDSPMRHHPLTPMTESRVASILQPQTTRTIGEVPVEVVRQGPDAVRAALDASSAAYLVVDATTNAELQTVQAATRDWRVLSGSAGLAFGMRGEHDPASQRFDAPAGRRLVVCGSASAKTRAQIAHALASGAAGFKLDVDRAIAAPDAVVGEVAEWLAGLAEEAVPVVYSVATLDDIRAGEAAAGPTAAEAVEAVLSRVVVEAVERLGVRRIVVAGGETSGAVATALGCARLLIGPQLAPGVCWSLTRTGEAGGGAGRASGTEVALALKSGNFGADDLFISAWEALS